MNSPVQNVWIAGSILRMRRLWPDPHPNVPVEELCRQPARPRRGDRPWVAICMVSSIDGAVAVDGRSGGLSAPADAAVLSGLRAVADVIIVGSGTAHAEGYGPPRKAGQRVGVVTNTGRVDPDLGVFRSGAGFLITTETAPSHGIDALRAGDDRVDLVAAVARLDAEIVQAEGGPTLNGALLAADLVDEVNLTLAPALVAGHGPRITDGAHEHFRSMDLVQIAEADGYLFLRYQRPR